MTCKNSLFHFSCISDWWKINKNCPICRKTHNIKNKDYKYIHKDSILKSINLSIDNTFIDD